MKILISQLVSILRLASVFGSLNASPSFGKYHGRPKIKDQHRCGGPITYFSESLSAPHVFKLECGTASRDARGRSEPRANSKRLSLIGANPRGKSTPELKPAATDRELLKLCNSLSFKGELLALFVEKKHAPAPVSFKRTYYFLFSRCPVVEDVSGFPQNMSPRG